ncbi:MAG: hypothetical protein E6J71_13375 [Deltaproteobacteria bacterium]|nr:MAG: hypothetical protein E6J81_13425 [Deltaproteobacteria bacterium]TMA88877.1 MAG: hypothetical protein E6J77_08340 [Deltaproteobacteria bacterium]TMB18000.1 MAG: hypothetical protein E6J71_13375 [Deltaproteobacteria bacterium]
MALHRMTRATIPDKLRSAKEAAIEQFLRVTDVVEATAFAVSVHPHDNVVGIGIGRKLVNGRPTDTPAVRFYVERKVAKGALPADLMLPKSVNGVATDVIESGRFRALPASVPLPRRRLRPARPGGSVGFKFPDPAHAQYVMAGTFGAVAEASGTRYILSNNHVLADENTLSIGGAIFQPGLLDNGDVGKDQIAKLTRFVPVKAGGGNTVDCAIAEVLDPKLVRATFLPKVGKLKSPEPIAAAEGMRVMKVGRTTGFTTGVVTDVSATLKVKYDLGVVRFDDQVFLEGDRGAFSDRGDSGSLIVDRATHRPTALLFAGSPAFTAGNHVSAVLAELAVSVVV